MNCLVFSFRNDDETTDDTLPNNSLLTTASGPNDDRHARHITHDNRLLLPSILRRRLDHLGNRLPSFILSTRFSSF